VAAAVVLTRAAHLLVAVAPRLLVVAQRLRAAAAIHLQMVEAALRQHLLRAASANPFCS
jgi:hypothetical protein